MASSFFNNRAHAAAAGTSSRPEKQVSEAPRLQPWVEKYRPKSLDDVTAQDHTITVLQRTLNATNLPHMLFYGPPGTGKTSTILALAKELYGPELFRSRVLELNASDERGISIVREKVKDFSRQQVSNAPISKEYREKYPCPPFKIIILDESDQMTSDAQSALRRTMETYSRTTRFCLICNYVTRIIDPLASRCSKFRFKSLGGIDAGKRLQDIAAAEDVKYEDGVIEKLIECSEGDLRRAITYLQSAARMVSAGTAAPVTNGHAGKKGKKSRVVTDDDDEEMMGVDEPSPTGVVTVPNIEEIAGVVPEPVIEKLLDAMSQKRMYDAVAEVVKELVADGWSANQLLIQLYEKILYNDTIPSRQKNQIVMVFSEVDKRLVDGSDELLSTLDLSLRVGGILAQG